MLTVMLNKGSDKPGVCRPWTCELAIKARSPRWTAAFGARN